MDLSIIIPIYNTECYLSTCLDSIKMVEGLSVEIILVNDGSTDLSGKIAEEYALRDRRIHVIHQENGGASVARNRGLREAKGHYVAFIDSDDWIQMESLVALYDEALEYAADIVVGNIWLSGEDGTGRECFRWVEMDLSTKILSGCDAFVRLVENKFYTATPVRYLYRRDYLLGIGARFEEGIIHEDELWTPFVLYQAELVVMTDIGFYFYRQNTDSVMGITTRSCRFRSLSRVAEGLFRLADDMGYEDGEGSLRSWWTANAYRLYAWACDWLPRLRDSSLGVPTDPLERFGREAGRMLPEAVERTRLYYESAFGSWRRYMDWRVSGEVASVAWVRAKGCRLLLIYNTPKGDIPHWDRLSVPEGWVATNDRHYLREADAVVFHLPTLCQELESDLEKPEGQLWIYGFRNSEADDAMLHDPEVTALFDGSFCFPPKEEETPFPMAAILRALGMETDKWPK